MVTMFIALKKTAWYYSVINSERVISRRRLESEELNPRKAQVSNRIKSTI